MHSRFSKLFCQSKHVQARPSTSKHVQARPSTSKRRTKIRQFSKTLPAYDRLEEKKLLAIDFTGGGLPADQTANAYLFVGDHSSSNSEIYSLNVDGQTIQPSSHGEVARERGTFERGESYDTSVQWVSTDRTDEDGNDDPDYDYRAWVDRLANPRWTSGDSVPSSRDFFVTDNSQLFQRREFGDDTDSTVGKQATIHFPAIDLDIDSDNSGLINGSLSEDVIENNQREGLEISVFSGDIDGDDVPDNYGLDGIAGVRFTPIQVSLSSNLQYVGGSTSLTFEFDDAGLVLESDGLFRLWKKDAAANRTEADLIASDSPVNASDLGLEPGGTATLYLEAVNPTRRTVNFDPITVTANVSSGVWNGTLTDKVHVKGKKVAIDVSVNGDDDLNDAVDGIDKFLPGYEGDNAVLTLENQQTVKLIITGLEAGSSVNLSLNETTKLTGLAGNVGGSDAFDYQFSNGGQQIEGLVAGGDGTLAVELNVLDFGGKTIVKVQDADGVELATLAIPLDGDGDSLPDVFEDRYDNLDKTKAETTAGTNDAQFDGDILNAGGSEFARRGTQVGDKLTAFDEYRGFILDDGHVRTDPEIKDIFVFDELGQITLPDGTELGDERFDLVEQLGVVLHAFSTPGQFDAQTNKLNINSDSAVKGDVIRLQQNNELAVGLLGNTDDRSVSIAVDSHFESIDIISVNSVGAEPVVIYKPTDTRRFAVNGRVGIGGTTYSYTTNNVQIKVGAAGNAILQEETQNVGEDLPAGSKTIILSENTTEKYQFLLNESTGEVINFSFPLAAIAPAGGQSTTLADAIDADDNTLTIPLNNLLSNSLSFSGALIYIKIGDEYLSYTSFQSNVGAGTITLLDVSRGQLGTVAQAHEAGALASVPSQFVNVDRGALGTAVGAFSAGDKLTPVAFLRNVVEVGGALAGPPAGATRFAVFSDPKSVLQVTIAHELTHALIDSGGNVEHGVAQPREPSIINSIMGPSTTLGRYVGGETETDRNTGLPIGSKLFTFFSDATREQIDLLFEI